MMKSTIKSLLIALVLGTGTSYGQTPFYMEYLSTFNPAASGFGDSLSISSNFSLSRRNSTLLSNINYKSKLFHGGFSASTIQNRFEGHGSWTTANINYSYHIRTGKKSTLVIGAGLNYYYFTHKDDYSSYHSDKFSGSIGLHFQSNRFRIGTSFTPNFGGYNSYEKLGLSSFYADYTFRLGENWNLQAGVAGVGYYGYVTALMKYRDKLWFGGNVGYGNQNLLFGMNLKQGLTVGASVGLTRAYGPASYFSGSAFIKANLFELFKK